MTVLGALAPSADKLGNLDVKIGKTGTRPTRPQDFDSGGSGPATGRDLPNADRPAGRPPAAVLTGKCDCSRAETACKRGKTPRTGGNLVKLRVVRPSLSGMDHRPDHSGRSRGNPGRLVLTLQPAIC